MRSLLLLVGLLAVLSLSSPARAGILPSCCVSEGETHPAEPPDPRNPVPILVPAEVRRPEERALMAGAEAPIEEDVPLANAVAIPVDEPRVVVPTTPEPIIAAYPEAPDFDLELPPCCQVEGESHPPDRDEEDATPILVGAKVKSPDERALEAGAELPIPVEVRRVDAIGISLLAQRGVSEPDYRPALVDAVRSWLSNLEGRTMPIAMALLLLLAILWIRWPLRRPKRLEDQPSPPRPHYSGELLLHNLVSARSFKPTSEPTEERELEPA